MRKDVGFKKELKIPEVKSDLSCYDDVFDFYKSDDHVMSYSDVKVELFRVLVFEGFLTVNEELSELVWDHSLSIDDIKVYDFDSFERICMHNIDRFINYVNMYGFNRDACFFMKSILKELLKNHDVTPADIIVLGYNEDQGEHVLRHVTRLLKKQLTKRGIETDTEANEGAYATLENYFNQYMNYHYGDAVKEVESEMRDIFAGVLNKK